MQIKCYFKAEWDQLTLQCAHYSTSKIKKQSFTKQLPTLVIFKKTKSFHK